MKKKLKYLTNDYGWAIYDEASGDLLAWGQFGDDLFFGLRRLGEVLGWTLSSGTLPPFDGEPPAPKL